MSDISKSVEVPSNERLRIALRQLIHRAGEELGGFHPVVTLAEEVLEMVPAPETGALPRCQCGMYPFGTPPNESVRIEDLNGVHYWNRPCQIGQQDALKAPVQRHAATCDCHDCHYAKKHPQVKPHHAACGCFECTGAERKADAGSKLGDPHPPSCACWECCK